MVVAPLYTSPPELTFRVPAEREERKREEEKVEEAVEKRPCEKPMVVEVLL